MKKLTIALVDRIHRETGVNVTLLTSDEWRHADPKAQRMLIQEYLRETHQSDKSDGIHIPDNYAKLLVDAVNYFFSPLPNPGSGTGKP